MGSFTAEVKSDTISIVKNSGIGIAGQVIFVLLRFAVSIIIARTIGSESYGIFVLAMTIISFVEVLPLLGMENAMVKFAAEFKALKDSARLKGTIPRGVAMTLMMAGLFSTSYLLLLWLLKLPEEGRIMLTSLKDKILKRT